MEEGITLDGIYYSHEERMRFFSASHPLRFKILQLLREKELYINQIVTELGIDRTSAVWHLSQLDREGFLERKYEHLKEPGKAAKHYSTKEEEFQKLRKYIIDSLENLVKKCDT